MTNFLISILLVMFKIIQPFVKRAREKEYITATDGSQIELDQTGRVADFTRPVTYLTSDLYKTIQFPLFDGLISHSFWRSQEITLFKTFLQDKDGYTLDFGCGDGVLTSTLDKNITYGVDIDPTALKLARLTKRYKNLLSLEDATQQIPSNTIDTVFSVSVLEHTNNLGECFDFAHDKLKKGGLLCFSVPTDEFHNIVASEFGTNFEQHVREYMSHRNILSPDDWSRIASKHGFKEIQRINFQDISFTRAYFALNMLSPKALGRIPFASKFLTSLLREHLLRKVHYSINERSSSKRANVLITMTKV